MRKGSKMTPIQKKNISNAKKILFSKPEMRLKISEATKKAMANPLIRMKISNALKGKPSWNKGIPMSKETKEKDRLAHLGQVSWNKGKKLPEMSGEKHPMFGKHHSEESIKKMSEAKKGKMIGKNNPFYGKHHTEETMKKISETKRRLYAEGKLVSPMKGKKTGKPAWNSGKKGLQVGWNKGKTIPPEVIRKMVETRMKNDSYKHTPEQKIKVSLALKGRKHTEESKRMMSIAQKKVWLDPEIRRRKSESQKGRKQSEESKKAHSEYMKRYFQTHKHPMIGKKLSKETIEKTRLANIGRTPWNKNKKMPELSEWGRQNILKQYQSGIFPKQENTKIEQEIKAELLKRGYKEGTDFIHQYKFMGKFMCDFCFPQQKVIIETYGDFWHANPAKYAGKELHPHQKKDIAKDRAKEAYIRKVDNGSWTLLIFWESDIKKNVSACVDKIEGSLRKKV